MIVERGDIERGMYLTCGTRVVGLESGQRFRAVDLTAQDAEPSATPTMTDYTEMWSCSDADHHG